MERPYSIIYYHALVDYPSNAILTMSTHLASIVFLSKCTPNAYYVAYVNSPNYTESFLSLFFLSSINPEDLPKWTWDSKNRKFIKTKAHTLSDQFLAKSRLTESKRVEIEKIINILNNARSAVATGVLFQEQIYLTKKMQAEEFRDSGYDESFVMKYPYVMQYADYANISLRQAADDILLKAKFDDALLAKTELLRLKYFSTIKNATEADQLPDIFEEFMRNYHLNAKV